MNTHNTVTTATGTNIEPKEHKTVRQHRTRTAKTKTKGSKPISRKRKINTSARLSPSPSLPSSLSNSEIGEPSQKESEESMAESNTQKEGNNDITTTTTTTGKCQIERNTEIVQTIENSQHRHTQNGAAYAYNGTTTTTMPTSMEIRPLRNDVQTPIPFELNYSGMFEPGAELRYIQSRLSNNYAPQQTPHMDRRITIQPALRMMNSSSVGPIMGTDYQTQMESHQRELEDAQERGLSEQMTDAEGIAATIAAINRSIQTTDIRTYEVAEEPLRIVMNVPAEMMRGSHMRIFIRDGTEFNSMSSNMTPELMGGACCLTLKITFKHLSPSLPHSLLPSLLNYIVFIIILQKFIFNSNLFFKKTPPHAVLNTVFGRRNELNLEQRNEIGDFMRTVGVDVQTALQAISNARGNFDVAAMDILEKRREEITKMNEENLRAGIEASLRNGMQEVENTKDEDSSCIICCNSMKNASEHAKVKFPCNHICCLACAKKLISTTNTCHICRARIK